MAAPIGPKVIPTPAPIAAIVSADAPAPWTWAPNVFPVVAATCTDRCDGPTSSPSIGAPIIRP